MAEHTPTPENIGMNDYTDNQDSAAYGRDELKMALEDAIELINDINGCHGCADNSTDPDESRRKALAAALAKATAHETRMQQQDLDEETL